MHQTIVLFNDNPILVQFYGSDETQIPSLISALKNNKITLHSMGNSPSHVELYGNEAIIHSNENLSYRIPLF